MMEELLKVQLLKTKIKKENTWKVNGITKNELLSIGIGNFRGEERNSKNLTSNFKGSLFYSLSQKFPIVVDKPQDKLIDKSFKFTQFLEFII